MKVIIVLNTAWNLFNFRAGLIQTLVANGYEVVAVAPNDKYAENVSQLGCRFIPLYMDNGGVHPGRDLLLFWRFWWLLFRERPNIYLGYTIKPNIYGAFAAQILGIPVVNNISGLGSTLISKGFLAKIVRFMYLVVLRRSAKVFFQNSDDKKYFIESRLVKASISDLVPGSGIDLNHFMPRPASFEAVGVFKFRFLLVARMLGDKGVYEYVEAAALIKKKWPQVECCLLGFLSANNPTAISSEEMSAWVTEGNIEYLGESDDVRYEISQADCIVLPSYREGLPRTLLEAAALARPIIATNVPGCREVVDHGVNGYLCNVCDSLDLASKMEAMMNLSPSRRYEMGLKGRAKVEIQFDEKIVINKYLSTIKKILTE